MKGHLVLMASPGFTLMTSGSLCSTHNTSALKPKVTSGQREGEEHKKTNMLCSRHRTQFYSPLLYMTRLPSICKNIMILMLFRYIMKCILCAVPFCRFLLLLVIKSSVLVLRVLFSFSVLYMNKNIFQISIFPGPFLLPKP